MSSRRSKTDWAQLFHKVLNDAVLLSTLVLGAPYYELFRRGTYKPVKRILESATNEDACKLLQEWCRYKTREAGYVQVAGAVLFAAITGCLSWPITTTSHWTGPALWYASIVFAVCSILTGAQQTLYLGANGVMSEPTSWEIAQTKQSLASQIHGNRVPSAFVVFAWQVPVMLLCYSILCFLAGLCSVIYSPLSRRLEWDAESKTALLFSIAGAGCLLLWAVASLIVFRLKIPGHMDLGRRPEDIEMMHRQAVR